MPQTIKDLVALKEEKERLLQANLEQHELVQREFAQLDHPKNKDVLYKHINLEMDRDQLIERHKDKKTGRIDATPEYRLKLAALNQQINKFQSSLSLDQRQFLAVSKRSARLANVASDLRSDIGTLNKAIQQKNPKIAQGIVCRSQLIKDALKILKPTPMIEALLKNLDSNTTSADSKKDVAPDLDVQPRRPKGP